MDEDINGIRITFAEKVGPIQIFAFDRNVDAMDRNSVATEKIIASSIVDILSGKIIGWM